MNLPSRIVNKNLVLNQDTDFQGRVAHELETNPKNAFAKIAGAIHKAGIVMGISIDAEKSVITAQESLRKLNEVFPLALIDDVCKAIEMASYGEIKLQDQLKVVSASNIYQWYKEARVNHPDKLFQKTDNKIQQMEIDPTEKFRIMLQGFVDFIADPKKHEMATGIYYDRFAKMGLIDIDAKTKISLTISEIEKVLDFYPAEIVNDKLKRRQSYEFKCYFNELDSSKNVDWSVWHQNPVVLCAVKNIKTKYVQDCIEFYEQEELIELYKTNIANELEIDLS
jgi:hypothetical protein